jgi:hypothetical protein
MYAEVEYMVFEAYCMMKRVSSPYVASDWSAHPPQIVVKNIGNPKREIKPMLRFMYHVNRDDCCL